MVAFRIGTASPGSGRLHGRDSRAETGFSQERAAVVGWWSTQRVVLLARRPAGGQQWLRWAAVVRNFADEYRSGGSWGGSRGGKAAG